MRPATAEVLVRDSDSNVVPRTGQARFSVDVDGSADLAPLVLVASRDGMLELARATDELERFAATAFAHLWDECELWLLQLAATPADRFVARAELWRALRTAVGLDPDGYPPPDLAGEPVPA